MTSKEYARLEALLGKLTLKLGGAKVLIVNGYIQDGYHIGVYNSRGDCIKEGTHATIESTVKQINDNYES